MADAGTTRTVPAQAAPSGAGAEPDGDLATRLSELARALEHEASTEDTLVHVVRSAIELVPGVEEASISLVIGRERVESRVPSGPLPTVVDEIQSETGQGPCLDAVFEQRTVHVPDMAAEQRWPDFARRAAEAGAASMLSFQLFVDGDNLGALNLYARAPHAFDEESEHVGLLFSAHAAVAVAGVRQQQHLLAGLGDPRPHRPGQGHPHGALRRERATRAFSLLVRVSREQQPQAARHLPRSSSSPASWRGSRARRRPAPWRGPRRRTGEARVRRRGTVRAGPQLLDRAADGPAALERLPGGLPGDGRRRVQPGVDREALVAAAADVPEVGLHPLGGDVEDREAVPDALQVDHPRVGRLEAR